LLWCRAGGKAHKAGGWTRCKTIAKVTIVNTRGAGVGKTHKIIYRRRGERLGRAAKKKERLRDHQTKSRN